MTKAFFILKRLTKEKIDTVVKLGATTIFTGYTNISPETIQYAKKANLEINIEIGIFVGEELWKKYPDSLPVDKEGRPIRKIGWYAGVCPNNSKVRSEKITLIKQIVKDYDVDGIWLDFIRYPCHWEDVRSEQIVEYCFCKNCLERFNQDGGGEPEGKTWVKWKCQQITNFVKEVREIINKQNRHIDLGLFSVPWKPDEYNSALNRIIGQDLESLSHYVDVFSPMTYHRFTGNNPLWIKEITQYMSDATHKPVLPLIQTEDRAGKIVKHEFEDSLKYALSDSSQGVIIFFLEDILKKEAKSNVVKDNNKII